MKDRYKYRLKFSKLDKMKFIGHLDLLRIFQRAIKRANLPIEFSQGFNPHQMVSFALPLSLGLTSNGEYLDVNFTEEVPSDIVIKNLNNVLPKGLEILGCREILENEKSGAASAMAAKYFVFFPENIDLANIINEILTSKEILIEKKTKSGIKEVDIRQDIFDIEDISEGDMCKIKVFVSAGSEKNLKPELLVSHIYNRLKKELNPFEMEYIREDLYKMEEDKFVSLYCI